MWHRAAGGRERAGAAPVSPPGAVAVRPALPRRPSPPCRPELGAGAEPEAAGRPPVEPDPPPVPVPDAAAGRGLRWGRPAAAAPLSAGRLSTGAGTSGRPGAGRPEEDEGAGAADPVDERALRVALDRDRVLPGDLEDVAGLAALDVVAGDGLDRDAGLGQRLVDRVGPGADRDGHRLAARVHTVTVDRDGLVADLGPLDLELGLGRPAWPPPARRW